MDNWQASASSALNRAMGWIVAVWLIGAGLVVAGGEGFLICMGGAMLTVLLWAILQRCLPNPPRVKE